MTTSQIRGYSLRQTARYLETRFDADTRRRAIEALPSASRSMLNSFDAGEWYAREHSSALFRSIAGARGGDEAQAKEDLIACGEFIAGEATNTFLRLLMKIMTPTLFAKKVPDFWKRDHRGGHFEVDVTKAGEGKIDLKLVDVGDYDHIGPVAIGWIKFGMTSLGKKDVKVQLDGWSLDKPNPENVSYQVTWS